MTMLTYVWHGPPPNFAGMSPLQRLKFGPLNSFWWEAGGIQAIRDAGHEWHFMITVTDVADLGLWKAFFEAHRPELLEGENSTIRVATDFVAQCCEMIRLHICPRDSAGAPRPMPPMMDGWLEEIQRAAHAIYARATRTMPQPPPDSVVQTLQRILSTLSPGTPQYQQCQAAIATKLGASGQRQRHLTAVITGKELTALLWRAALGGLTLDTSVVPGGIDPSVAPPSTCTELFEVFSPRGSKAPETIFCYDRLIATHIQTCSPPVARARSAVVADMLSPRAETSGVTVQQFSSMAPRFVIYNADHFTLFPQLRTHLISFLNALRESHEARAIFPHLNEPTGGHKYDTYAAWEMRSGYPWSNVHFRIPHQLSPDKVQGDLIAIAGTPLNFACNPPLADVFCNFSPRACWGGTLVALGVFLQIIQTNLRSEQNETLGVYNLWRGYATLASATIESGYDFLNTHSCHWTGLQHGQQGHASEREECGFFPNRCIPGFSVPLAPQFGEIASEGACDVACSGLIKIFSRSWLEENESAKISPR